MSIPPIRGNARCPEDLAPAVAGKTTALRFAFWFAAAVACACMATSPMRAQSSQPEKPAPKAAASASGQESPSTRKEQLEQLRLEKARNLVTPKQGILEKYAKNFDRKGSNSIEEVNFWGFHPRLDWIARGSGAALGVRYWKPEALGPVDVMGAAFYSWKRYQHYDLQLGLIPNRGKRIPSRSFETEQLEQLGDVDQGKFSRFKLYVSGRFRDRTDESFYGLGVDSQRDSRARYRIKDSLLEAVTGYQFTDRIGFSFSAGLLTQSLGRGRSDPPLERLFAVPELPGLSHPPNYFRYQTSFLFDYRDNPGVPHEGFMIAVGWQRFDNVNTADLFNFHRFAMDSRVYIPLGSRQRVIALRGMAVSSDPAPGNRVPFFLQPSLGGGESLRGYDAFRFQGDKLLLLQGEYRWEASRRIELALFGDTGTVANRGQRLALNKMKSDGGVGFRFKSSRSTMFRLDQAWGNEGARTQFRFSAVF